MRQSSSSAPARHQHVLVLSILCVAGMPPTRTHTLASQDAKTTDFLDARPVVCVPAALWQEIVAMPTQPGLPEHRVRLHKLMQRLLRERCGSLPEEAPQMERRRPCAREPFLSVVMAGRNDGYGGGGFARRLRVSVESLLRSADQAKLALEVVVTEWEPLQEQSDRNDPRPASLVEILSEPAMLVSCKGAQAEDCVPLSVKVVRVERGEDGEFREYHAKNVGIREAAGQYILATNADIILSQELIDALGSSPPRLSPDAYYRIDRHDLAAPVPLHFGERALNGRVQDLLEWCRRNVSAVQVSPIHGRFVIGAVDPDLYAHRMRDADTVWEGNTIRDNSDLHHMAAGDFMLMSRDRWNQLRGFPENKTNDMIDSCMVVLAAVSGMRQVYLTPPQRIYHQPHTRQEFCERVKTDVKDFIEWRRWQYSSARPMLTNDVAWGGGGSAWARGLHRVTDISLWCE